MYWKFCVILSVTITAICGTQVLDTVPEYVKQCREDDPKIFDCIQQAILHVKPYLASGIPEIQVPPIEPFQMQDFAIEFSGARKYKINLKNMDAYGASKFSLETVMLNPVDKPSQAIIRIPELRVNATYKSSGVLIIIPASGSGDFDGIFEDIKALVMGKVSIRTKHQKKHLHIDDLNVKLIDIKVTKMEIKNIFNNNQVLVKATNDFLKDSSDELVKVMSPLITKKLEEIFKKLGNRILSHVPIDIFLIPAEKKSLIF